MAEATESTRTDLSLVGNVYLRFTVIGFMYFSQGLPLGLFGVAFPTHLAEIGFTKSEIALFLTVIGLPWAFKFLAGPLMDRVAFLIYGHRRPWVVIAQLGLMITFAASAVVAGAGEPNLFVLAGCGFVLNVFASTQDVAVDGLAIGVLKEGERSKATALMFGSQSIGRLVGMVGGGFMLEMFGVSGACIAACLTVFLLLLLPVMLRERSVEKRFPWSSEGEIAPEILALKVDEFFPMLLDLLRKLIAPISLFFIVAFFCDSVAGGLLGAYLPSFSVIDLGWDDGAYNAWYGTIGLITAGTGLLLSPVFDYYGQRNCMVVLCVLTAVGIVAFVSIPALQQGLGWHIFMLGFWLSQHLFAVLIISSCMELVTPRIAASQFAIYMSIANLSSTIGNFVISQVADIWVFEVVLLLAAFFVLTAPILFWLTNLGVRKRPSVAAEAA